MPVKWYGLTHFRRYIIYVISQNVPILEISKRVGHSTPDITYGVYAHLYPNKDRNIAQKEDADFKNWDL